MGETDAVVQEGCSSSLGSVATSPRPEPVPAWGWGPMTVTVGPRVAAGSLANICPGGFADGAEVFPPAA